ncbi:MAG: undecaprenyl-diphosphate phosphatase [Gammaproteobacteria bacterium]|nr:undecaprenyl-diphosphate phosphatase [Gammaproteobacteria bacterium]
MDFLHILSLAILQGLTEFLPISSSAHLILLPLISGWQDQGLAFDVAVHVGTLSAVVFYFRHILKKLVADWFNSLLKKQLLGESKLAWAVLFGTIPVGLAGLLFNDIIETSLRSPLVIATTTIVFGVLLGWADWYGKQERTEHQLTWKDVVVVGIAQAIALIPGTSRSGITMTAGRLLGLSRTASAHFSFLLSIPVIILAGGLKTIELIQSNTTTDWFALCSGAIISALSAYLCITLFMRLLEKVGMWPFVIYRLILGAILIALFI